MSTSNIDIDLIPTSVLIYEKIGDAFVLVNLNKMAQKIELSPELYEVFSRVYKSAINEELQSAVYEDSHVKTWRNYIIKKMSNSNLIVFYDDNSLSRNNNGLLEHQKEMFQHIMENSEFISVQGYNENHEVVYWNKASEIIYGFSKTEALGKKLEDLIIPDVMKEGVHQAIENWIHNGVEIPSSELTLKDKDSKKLNVFSQHIMIDVGAGHHEMYCIDMDLKEIKNLQKELSVQKNLLEAIFNIIPDLIWLKDLNGVYMYCNQRFEQFFGAKESEILGKTDFDFVDTDLANFFRQNDLKALEENAPRRNEEYLVFHDGSYEGMFETTKVPMLDDEKNIIGVLGTAHDINKRKEREEKLKKYANEDVLTGLVNRNRFTNRLTYLLSEYEHGDDVHAVLFIDLDHFKTINDEKGHFIGDKVLIEVANRLRSVVRRGDTLSRFGGDEFIILLENITSTVDASMVAEKIVSTIREPIVVDDEELNVTVSVGISIFPDDSVEVEALIHYSDIAMYRAKSKGKNTFEFYRE